LRKPLEYHALGGQSFWIPSTGKYTIEKVKTFTGATPSGMNNEDFTHSSIPVSFYPLNKAKKLKKNEKK